jgi:hypothetical protein
MRFKFLLFNIVLFSFSSNLQAEETLSQFIDNENKTTAIANAVIPQIWSDHKILNISEEVCAKKGVDILTTLGFKHIVKNGTYVYGNYINNRSAIKCTRLNDQTFVFVVVAGPVVTIVERLRNEIVWKL